MNAEDLRKMTEEEVMEFIRERLTVSDEEVERLKSLFEEPYILENRLRFDMSGYETRTGDCTLWNMMIVNRFADLGIYDYTKYLFLDFYKGCPTLYFTYFNDDEIYEIDSGGYGTRELIYQIFEATIFSDKPKRRRDN